VPQQVIDAVTDYYVTMNANHGGVFATSQRSDAMGHQARQVAARFLNASRPEEIVFGPNMTTLNFALSRAIARTLQAGDEIVVTHMDHDANIAPWLRIAQDHDLTVRWVDFDVEAGTLDRRSLQTAITSRTRVVAAVHASNALGTINPVSTIARMAHDAGAYCVVDAVQSAPHIPIDVQAIDCDFLLCSAYKFFGPHIGVMYGKHQHLVDLPAYKVRPADDSPPYKWETGTPSYETWAGTAAAITYINDVGLDHIMAYEQDLVLYLLDRLRTLPRVQVYGITDPAQITERVPTVICNVAGHRPRAVAEFLGKRHIYLWNGNYYALAVMERLGLQASGGAVRIGLAHYNTHDEIDRLIDALAEL